MQSNHLLLIGLQVPILIKRLSIGHRICDSISRENYYFLFSFLLFDRGRFSFYSFFPVKGFHSDYRHANERRKEGRKRRKFDIYGTIFSSPFRVSKNSVVPKFAILHGKDTELFVVLLPLHISVYIGARKDV